MKSLARRWIDRENLALVTGSILVYLSVPGKGQGAWYLAFFAFMPLFHFISSRKTGWERLTGGLFFGFVASVPMLTWIDFTLSTYGGLGHILGFAAVFLLAVFLGIYFSVFSFLTGLIVDSTGATGFLFAPFAWAFIEILRLKWDLGFPWLLLGYSQEGNLYLRNFASYVGITGLGFIVMLVNSLFFLGFKNLAMRRKTGAVLFFLAGIGVVGLCYLGGRSHALGYEERVEEGKVRVRIVQPSIDQWKKWDEDFRDDTFRILSSLSFEKTDSLDLIVWPETALPFFVYVEEEPTKKFMEILEKSPAPILTGVPWFDPVGERFFNSIVLFERNGDISRRYDKIKLVPFGEYVPFRPVLFFVDKLTGGGEDFSRGREVVIIENGKCKIVPSVCYEAIFPQLSVEGVSRGGNLLVNLTNDAWFGDTSAPYQHLAMARMRAVETGRYMLRCANAGISAVIDWRGEVVKEIPLFERDAVDVEVPLYAGMTFYVKNANLINSCVLIGFPLIMTMVFIIRRCRYGRRI